MSQGHSHYYQSVGFLFIYGEGYRLLYMYYYERLKENFGVFLQIVLPSQAEMMYEAIKKKGIPTMFVLFKGLFYELVTIFRNHTIMATITR